MDDKPTTPEDLIDSLNRIYAILARLEAGLLEQTRTMTQYVETMDRTYRAIIEARRPWWRR